MKFGLILKLTRKSKKMVTNAKKFSKKYKKYGKSLSKASKKTKQQFKKLRKKAGRVWENMKCNALWGHPVDAVSGEVVTEHLDFSLPWRIPITWHRYYGSQNKRIGACGYGWETPADIRLEFNNDGSIVFHDGTGAPVFFDYMPERKPVFGHVDGSMLQREKDCYIVSIKEDLIYCFPIKEEPLKEVFAECVKDPWGNKIEYIRDKNGLKEIRESSGRQIAVISRNGRIEKMSLVYPYRDSLLLVYYEYDDNGNLIAAYDAMKASFRFAYENHLLIRETNKNGLSFNYEYDEYTHDGKCIHTFGDGGLYDYRFTYRDEEKITEVADSSGNVTYLKFNDQYMITEQTDFLGGVTCYKYDDIGRTSAVIDPDGNKTEYVYDKRGNLVKLIRPDGKFVATEYNNSNKPVKITDPNGAVWQQEWSPEGFLIRQTTPIGAALEYEYDKDGQLKSFTNPMGALTKLSYDKFGNLAEITDALGNTTKYTYDVLGNVVTKTDPSGKVTKCEYDLKGRLTKVIEPGGASIVYGYDPQDNLNYLKDKNGLITRMEYCGMGEVKRHILPDGNIVEYDYDMEENLISIRNQMGERYELKRDALGRIISEVDYWGQEQKYVYTAAGHLYESIDPMGRIVKYKTDSLGRILEKMIPHPKERDKYQTETFEYDANGNLIVCENENTRIECLYDTDGQMLEERQGDQCVVSNIYDLNGNRTQRTTKIQVGGKTFSRTIDYNYDALDQADSIEIPGYDPIRFAWNSLGQLTGETLSKSLKRRYNYNEEGYLTAQKVLAAEGPVFEQRYSYDEIGNLIKKHDSVFGYDKFSYDPIGRITSHVNPEGRIKRYLHDPVGDLLTTRVCRTEDSKTEWTREGEYEGISYRFDRAGNLIERRGGKETNFIWDANQRLVESTADGLKTTYKYDPLGRRIVKETDGLSTSFFWDGNILLGDIKQEPADKTKPMSIILREYIYYPYSFEPLAMVKTQDMKDSSDDVQESLYIYHNDINGCPVRLMDTEGKVVWAAGYDAIGKVEALHADEVDNPLRLQGQYFDKETGLNYNRFRYFDPDICSFISQDPMGLEAGLNVYAYAPNVWTWTDPLGLKKHKANRVRKTKKGSSRKYKYNMIENPGPLAKVNPDAAATFASGKYNMEVLKEDRIFYRGGKAGGGKNGLGQYFTETPPESRVKVRIDTAVKAQWIDPKTGVLTGTSPIESVYAVKIPKGTTIYKGPTGYQSGIYLGPQEQVFISKPWNIPGVQVISETPLP